MNRYWTEYHYADGYNRGRVASGEGKHDGNGYFATEQDAREDVALYLKRTANITDRASVIYLYLDAKRINTLHEEGESNA